MHLIKNHFPWNRINKGKHVVKVQIGGLPLIEVHHILVFDLENEVINNRVENRVRLLEEVDLVQRNEGGRFDIQRDELQVNPG